jgi:hypothetical protein
MQNPNHSQSGVSISLCVGKNMITPIKKPPHRDLLDWEKEFNTQVNKIRWVIEQVIAHLKTWRILDTDYQRPIDTFRTTISAVGGIHLTGLAEVSGSPWSSLVEDQPSVAGSARLKRNKNSVMYLGRWGDLHRALVGTEQSPLDQRGDPVHRGQQLAGVRLVRSDEYPDQPL